MWSRCYSWRRLNILYGNKTNAWLSACRTRLNASPMGPQGRYSGWWQICVDQPRWGLASLVGISIHLSCKYAKKRASGPHALAEASDVAQRNCLEAGRPGLDIVCGDINMARPPLSSFTYMSLSRFGHSSGFFSRRSASLLRAAPLPRCSALLPCCSALLLAAQCSPRCCSVCCIT